MWTVGLLGRLNIRIKSCVSYFSWFFAALLLITNFKTSQVKHSADQQLTFDEDIRLSNFGNLKVLIVSPSQVENEGLWVLVEKVEIPKTFESVFNIFYGS